MLEARAVSVIIERGKALLREVSLGLRPGELLALAGENGAGKSTLLKALAGDIACSSGSVSMNGRTLRDWPLRARARLRAVLPQDQAAVFGFSALETVLLGRYPHCNGRTGAADLAAARDALESMDARALENRRVDTLSGGERARVMMARALAQIWDAEDAAPRYLMLDEPVAALDLAHQHRALRVIRRFARDQGVGVVAVLHDLNLAARYADRIAVLKHGRLAAIGTPVEVLTESMIADCFAIRSIVMRHPHSDCVLVVAAPETPAWT